MISEISIYVHVLTHTWKHYFLRVSNKTDSHLSFFLAKFHVVDHRTKSNMFTLLTKRILLPQLICAYRCRSTSRLVDFIKCYTFLFIRPELILIQKRYRKQRRPGAYSFTGILLTRLVLHF